MDQQTAGRHTGKHNTAAPPHAHSTPEYTQNVHVQSELALSGKGVCACNLKGPGCEYGCVDVDVWDEKYLGLIPEWYLEIKSIVRFSMCLNFVIYFLYC